MGSREIRDKIHSKQIIVPFFDESRIQPSSFEPSLSDEAYIIDDSAGGIRPLKSQTVYRSLLELPVRKRQRVSIADGFEICKGYTYLVPLQERFRVYADEMHKSSPKSSYGRLFKNSRLIFDYSPCFDETNERYSGSREIQAWLLVQPLSFNSIIRPGLTMNQLRIFVGNDAQLNQTQIAREFAKHPLLYDRNEHDLASSTPIISDGLQIHLDLEGRNTGGIVALRARNNPTPIDLANVNAYDPEDYFEPIKARNGRIAIKRGEHYLLASKEVLDIPAHLNSELRSHSHVGIMGFLHFAGFIDPGFKGDLVFEVRSDEISDVVLTDGMPISRLEIFRNMAPDKVYGKDIGSNYQKQTGPRPSKHFRPFDFNLAAKNYGKLDRDVLVQDARVLSELRTSANGFEPINSHTASKLENLVSEGFFHSRYDCEIDESVLQIIPYIIVFGPDRTVFTYVRSNEMVNFGEQRLFGKHSIGVGGHIGRDDGPDYLTKGLNRELSEEVLIKGQKSKPTLVGTLMAHDTPVDRVHFGLIYGIKTNGSVERNEEALASGGLKPIADLINTSDRRPFETWSKILIPHLESIRSAVYRR